MLGLFGQVRYGCADHATRVAALPHSAIPCTRPDIARRDRGSARAATRHGPRITRTDLCVGKPTGRWGDGEMTARRIRFAARRKAMSLTQEELAGHLGVDVSTVRRWERGQSEPQPWMREKIARTLQVSLALLDELLMAKSATPRWPSPHRRGAP
jgi:DNA-binding XRE family transcriptional regulator